VVNLQGLIGWQNIFKTPTPNPNIFLPKETTTIRRNVHALRNNVSSVSVELLGLGNLLAHVANVVLAGYRSLFWGGIYLAFISLRPAQSAGWGMSKMAVPLNPQGFDISF
jgi:hypothetical protein